jgi:protein-S-isoprenylcysteine O-methyltransferase Ste14
MTSLTPYPVVIGIWLVWLASWWIAAFWSDRTAKRPAVRDQVMHRAAVIGGSALLFNSRLDAARYGQLWTPSPDIGWTCVAFTAAGVLFSWWARIHIGRLWSGGVSRKSDHHVVQSGPYAIVRHPIYTGLIFSAVATATLTGCPLALAGALVISFGFWLKARLEERFLREELGAGAYDAYRRRVPMLVPFGPTARS